MPIERSELYSPSRDFLGLVVVIASVVLLCDARLWRPGTVLTIRENIQIAEAQAWWQGRMDLPERKWDTALFHGRVYSHFPPMFTLLSAAIVPGFGGVPHWVLVLLLAAPAPPLAYILFSRLTRSPRWGSVLALGLMGGTSVLPVLEAALRGGGPYAVNQMLALNGLLLFLVEYFGRRRIAVQAAGVVIAAWSRQLTIAFVIPMLWSAWRDGNEGQGTRRRGLALAAVAFVAAVPILLNILKFENPLDSGYRHVYEDRPEDRFSRDARAYGIFSAHYVPRNLYHANIGAPDLHWIRVAGDEQLYLRPNMAGTGIWWTTPLLLWVWVDLRSILREPRRRILLLAALLANLSLLFYHSTGYEQRGFNRYSLDFVPALLALAAPAAVTGWRRMASAAMIAWSVLYFGFWIDWPHVRVW